MSGSNSGSAKATNPWGPPQPQPQTGCASQLTATAAPFRPPPPFCLSSDPLRPGEAAGPQLPGNGGGVLNNSLGSAPLLGTPGPAGGGCSRKAELCRSYEIHGTCAFKQCAFAHSLDDLRACGGGGGSTNTTPHMGTHTVQGQTTSGRTSHSNTPLISSNAFQPFGGAGGGPGMGTGGTSPPPPAAPSPAGAPASIGSGAPSPSVLQQQQQQQQLQQNAMTSSLTLVEQLTTQILEESKREKSALATVQDANRRLEASLKQEQLERQRAANNVAALEGMIGAVEEALKARNGILSQLRADYDMEAVVDDTIGND